MQNFIRMTFGGLSKQYFFRQLFFGSFFFAMIIWVQVMNPQQIKYDLIVVSAICTLLYPYSRFVYERIIGFIVGENVFFVAAPFMLFVKLFTMLLCWAFAIFVAPVGLVYLYFHHSRAV